MGARIERNAALDTIYHSMSSGGFLALWENNPWNPATRLVMSRIPFDRDADPIFPRGCRRMIRSARFELLGADYLFIFPKLLRLLRIIEPWVCRLPFGTQYLILARKSSTV